MSPEGGAKPKIKPATARVFFALWPSREVAVALADRANQAADRYGGRATRTDSIHLTLAFVGEVPEASLPLLSAIGGSIKVRPFTLSIDRLGFWSHNHLLSAGCDEIPVALATLVGELQQGLGAAGFMLDGAARCFTPHVTLVRKIPAATAPRAGEALPEISRLPWPVLRWVLVRSCLSATGTHYQVVAEFPLSA